MLQAILSPQILSGFCREFSGLFDPTVYINFSTSSDSEVILPEKLKDAVEKRKAEYCAGRVAAKAALKLAGCECTTQIGVHPDRSPAWPEGFVGSITHTGRYVSAAVARSIHVRAIGRDSEGYLDESTALKIESHILSQDELLFQSASGLSRADFVGVAFSAKESVFKALSPIVQKFFSFHEVQMLSISKDEGIIRFQLVSDLGHEFEKGYELSARFKLDEWIHTAVEIL